MQASADIVWTQFREFKPTSDLAYKTTRSVKVTAECSQYPITDGQKGQGTEITFLNGTSEETLTTPDVSIARVTRGHTSTWCTPLTRS